MRVGDAIGVNESRVSQLHARAIRRLREAIEKMVPPAEARDAMRGAILEFQKAKMAKASLVSRSRSQAADGQASGVVVKYPGAARAARAKTESRKGFQRAADGAGRAPAVAAAMAR